MQINKISKKKENIEYITVKDLENKNSGGILILEEEYFQIVKIILEKDLEDKERDLEIEEQLENRITDYDPLEYIEKEISLSEDSEEEEIAVILLKRNNLYNLLEKAEKNNIKLFGVIPIFLLSLTIEKEKENEIFIYLQQEKTIAAVFKKSELTDLLSVEIEKEDIFYEGVENLLEEITFAETEKIERIHLWEKDKDLEKKFLSYGEVVIDTLENFPIIHKESCCFLPLEYKDKFKKKKYIKLLGTILLTILLIEFGAGFLFSKFQKKDKESIAKFQNEIGIYKEKIDNRKKEIEEFTDFKEKSKELTVKMSFSNMKINLLLEELEKCQPNNLIFAAVEYNGDGILKVTGESPEEKKIIELEKNILQSQFFTHLSHDYIKRGKNSYLFQFDIGVENE